MGLSRPLAFLAPRDALLLRTIVKRADSDLKRDLRSWTAALIGDKARKPGGIGDEVVAEQTVEEEILSAGVRLPKQLGSRLSAEDYADMDEVWFSVWLQKQEIVHHICRSMPFVVVSDIANFFPSIDLEVIREHLLSTTSLDKEVVRLAVYLIERVARHPRFADSPSMGLPQENFSSSRAIAHSLLVEVDSKFDKEGAAGIYARFMDDFTIGAQSIADGERKVARLQAALEPLGLYPNTAKTRIIATAAYLRDLMVDENDQLDEVEAVLETFEASGPLRQIVDLPLDVYAGCETSARAHRSIPIADRSKGWERVLRRHYTQLRTVGSDLFLSALVHDIEATPAGVVSYLEYARSFPLSTKLVKELFQLAVDVADIYENVALLAIETISTAPNSGTEDLSQVIMGEVEQLIERLNGQPLEDRIVSALVPIVVKFGGESATRKFLANVQNMDQSSVARLSAYGLGLAVGQPDGELSARYLPGLSWEAVLTIQFIEAVHSGDQSALGTMLGLLEPRPRLKPQRWHLHVRPLALLPLVRDRRFVNAVPKSLAKLRKNPERLRDRAIEQVLDGWLLQQG